jgi:WD40 repeat protein
MIQSLPKRHDFALGFNRVWLHARVTVPQQKFLFSLNGHTNWVRTCQLSPDARLAVSGGDDHSVRVWDLETRATLHAFDELDGSVNVAAFHPDGAPAGWLAAHRPALLARLRAR